MPDLDDLKKNKAIQEISIDWMKNRNTSPPRDVTPKPLIASNSRTGQAIG